MEADETGDRYAQGLCPGLELIGNPSAIVPVMVGDEALARLVSRQLPEFGLVANLVEYPAVAKGNARFRFQVMSGHTAESAKRCSASAAPSMPGKPNTSNTGGGCR